MNQNLNYVPNKNNGEEKKKLKLIIKKEDKVAFNGLLKTKLTTSVKLAQFVNGIFRPLFNDWEGCVIFPQTNQAGKVEPVLIMYFKEKGIKDPNKMNALVNANTMVNRNSSAGDKIKALNSINRMRNYDLSDEAKEIFGNLMFVRHGQNINWNNLIAEQTQQTYNGYNVYVKVAGVSLIKILREAYKSEDEKKDTRELDYDVSFIQSLGNQNPYMQNAANQNFLISILQLDTREVQSLANEIGIIPSAGQLPIVR